MNFVGLNPVFFGVWALAAIKFVRTPKFEPLATKQLAAKPLAATF